MIVKPRALARFLDLFLAYITHIETERVAFFSSTGELCADFFEEAGSPSQRLALYVCCNAVFSGNLDVLLIWLRIWCIFAC